MSEYTQCNYCSLQHYKWRARKEHKKLTLVGAKGGGLDIHLHRKGSKPNSRNRIGWFMELSDHCVC